MTTLSTIAFTLVLCSSALQGFSLLRRTVPNRGAGEPGAVRGGKAELSAQLMLIASAALLLLVTTIRSVQIGFVALTGTYEALVFYGAAIAIVASAYRFQRRIPYWPIVQFGTTIVIAAMLALASSPIAPKEALPPIPALKSYWLALHVAFSFIGEAFFVVSFAAAIGFLLSRDETRRTGYDRLAYTAVALGYPIFTAGALVFGAVWAERAWGAWWSWDPKETWALVTWLVYTAYLHLRLIRKKRDRLTALIAVIGFLCTLFTFFGVNYLLPGLHSYG